MRFVAIPIIAGLMLTACASVPTGPSVMVLPGNGKNFDQFQADDAVCRQWAAQQTGISGEKAASNSTVSGAAIGTALGAAAGAAIGAAAGSPGTGAAIGAGTGLLGGTAIGASRADTAHTSVQHRYDMSYMQCMYAKGNQIPVARGSVSSGYSAPPPGYSQPHAAPPPPPPSGGAVPPPPAGTPPPPPPGPTR
jgi:hypothetical protein